MIRIDFPQVATTEDEGNCPPPGWPVWQSDWTKVLGGKTSDAHMIDLLSLIVKTFSLKGKTISSHDITFN